MSFAGALAAACGGASNTGLGGGSDAGGDVRASGGDDAMAADSAGDGQNEGSVDGSSDGPGDAPSGGDAANDGPAAACPIVGGLYSMTVVDGAGCGDLNPLAVECIVQTSCAIQLQSKVAAAGRGIDGDTTVQSDGSFAGAALTEGTVKRGGCTGAWDATTSTMTVDCGGTGSSQACEVNLMRTALACP
jgi:hypothetical protein